jgi:hypothetical protein
MDSKTEESGFDSRQGKADYSSSSSTEVKYGGAIPALPPYVFVI